MSAGERLNAFYSKLDPVGLLVGHQQLQLGLAPCPLPY